MLIDGSSSNDPGSIMQFLDLLGRPAEAAFTGVKYGLDEDPNKTALQGAYRGLMGQEKTELSDIIGYDPNTAGGWTADLAAKMILDPLNLVPVTKVGRLAKMGIGAANDALAATNVGRHIMGKLNTYGKYAGVEEALMGSLAKTKPSVFESADLLQAYKDMLPAAAERTGMAPEELHKAIRKAWEEGGNAADTAAPELFNTYADMRGISENLMDTLQGGRQAIGQEASGRIANRVNPVTGELEFRYAPRELSPEGRDLVTTGTEGPRLWQKPQGVAETAEMDTRSLKSRQIQRFIDYDWYNNEGVIADPGHIKLDPNYQFFDTMGGNTAMQDLTKPVFSKMDGASLRSHGITKSVTQEGEAQYFMGKTRVQPIYSSLATMTESMPELEKLFQVHPAVSEFKHTVGLANKAAFVDWLGELRNQGILSHVPGELGDAIQGNARLAIPGFENLSGPKAVVNRIQNVGQVMYDPESALGQIDGALQHLLNYTKAGQLVKDYTGWWSRNTLALFPAFHLGNAISNLFLMYTSGTNPITGIRDGVNLLRKAGEVEGLPMEKLFIALKSRAGMEASWSADLLRDLEGGLDTIKNPYTHALTQKMPESLQPGGKALEKVATKWGDANRWGLKFGQQVEDTSRGGIFVDYVRKALKAEPGALHDEAALSSIFDKGAVHAADAMVDYGDLTSLARSLKSAVPFLSWYRGLMGRTLEDLGVAPQRLSRIGHALDFTFNSQTQYQQNLSPEYVQDQAPIMGLRAFGSNIPIPTTAGGPGMVLGGRMIPYQMIEGLLKRPGSTLGGFINPALKVLPETILNYDTQKGQNIDLLAQSPGQALTAPITGAPYSYASNRVAGLALPAGLQHILASVPGWRYVTNAVDPIARMLGTELDMPLLADPGRQPTSVPEQLAYMATGGKVYPWDQARYEKQKVGKFERQINELKRDSKYWAARGDMDKAQAALQMLERLLESTSPLGD